MLILQTLGRIRLTRADGSEIDQILRQPKRLALLAYLSAPRPGVWHRRDTLLAVFWSELDGTRARTALRNALYVLRQHLGDGVVRTRGDEEVSIDPALLTTDVSLLESDLAAARFADALLRCEGDLLPGLHIAGAGGFEAWLDDERTRLRGFAKAASAGLAQSREDAGDYTGAAEALAHAAKLDPVDESVVRRMMIVSDRAGDRARALVIYDRFRARLHEDLSAEPAPETTRLADEIRARRIAGETVPWGESANGALSSTKAQPQQTPADDPAQSSASTRALGHRARRRRWPLWVGAAAVLGAVTIAGTWHLTTRSNTAVPQNPKLLVMPMVNATGEPELDYLAKGIDDQIARRLRGIGGLATVQSAAYSVWPVNSVDSIPRIAREYKADYAFGGKLTRVGDSLVISGEVVKVAANEQSDIGSHSFVKDSTQEVSSRIAPAIAARLFKADLPAFPRGWQVRVHPESFDLTLKGWSEKFRNTDASNDSALALFLRATTIDATNARAWAGVSSAYAARMYTYPFEEVADQAEDAATRALALDPNDGTPWLNRAAIRGTRARSVAIAMPLFDTAMKVDPGNFEIYYVKGSFLRGAGLWEESRDAMRYAQKMDPFEWQAFGGEALLSLCTDNPAAALPLYKKLARMPNSTGADLGLARTYQRLGDWENAIAALHRHVRLRSDDAALAESTDVGAEGFWKLWYAYHEPRYQALLARSRKDYVNPTMLNGARIAAGHKEHGLDEFEQLVRQGSVRVERAWCNSQYEPVRRDPRFIALLHSLPKWTLPSSTPRPQHVSTQ